MNKLDAIARLLAAVFACDRLLKLAAVVHFFRRPPPPAPARWPSVTLLQPITRGATDLQGALVARRRLRYSASIQHLLICDVGDDDSQAVCRAFLASQPKLRGAVVLASEPGWAIASKITKLQTALPHAVGEVLCFVDDDVLLRPDALETLVRYLDQSNVGAVFGLACYVNWRTSWSSLMSIFVNANALLSYIPLTYLTEPFTITGHCFALRRPVFNQIGGLDHMQDRIDDDHELARRCQQAQLRIVQTPLIYDVTNDLPSFRAYAGQMRRWFVFPKQMMLPMMSGRDQAFTLLGSIGNLIPGIIGLLALFTRRKAAQRALGSSLLLFGAVYLFCESRYLGRWTPLRRLPLLPIVALVAPLQALWALWRGDEVTWRGQRLRVGRGGRIEVVE